MTTDDLRSRVSEILYKAANQSTLRGGVEADQCVASLESALRIMKAVQAREWLAELNSVSPETETNP